MPQVYDALSYYYDNREEVDPLVGARLGEDEFARKLPVGRPFVLRYNPTRDAFDVEYPSSPASKLAEGWASEGSTSVRT